MLAFTAASFVSEQGSTACRGVRRSISAAGIPNAPTVGADPSPATAAMHQPYILQRGDATVLVGADLPTAVHGRMITGGEGTVYRVSPTGPQREICRRCWLSDLVGNTRVGGY